MLKNLKIKIPTKPTIFKDFNNQNKYKTRCQFINTKNLKEENLLQ